MNSSHSPLTQENTRLHLPSAMLHIVICLFVLGFPFMMLNRSNFSTVQLLDFYLRFSDLPIATILLFYINYFWLVPKILFRERTELFFLCNVGLIILFSFALHFLPVLLELFNDPRPRRPRGGGGRGFRIHPPTWIFIVRNAFTLFLAAVAATGIRTSTRWKEAEAAREKAERSRSEAELRNLKNQLSPHFLLNTLNNIYALILFDTDKAQQAVLDLSKLLRYVLYEDSARFVPLSKEVAFIQNYIDLMRIRLDHHTDIRTEYQITEDSHTPVAPLLFISLIENAFKHSTSTGEETFIHLKIEEMLDGEIRCHIRNSNHPKTKNDKSGSGIGLEQVRNRLDLLYPGRYTWTYGTQEEGKVYSSLLILHTPALS